MKINLLHCIRISMLTICVLIPLLLDAHKPDQSYIYMRIYADGVGGRFEATSTDLNKTFGLNLSDNEMTLEEVLPHAARIQAYLDSMTTFSANGTTYNIKFDDVEVLNLNDMEDYAKFSFTLENVEEVPEALNISYNAFFDDSKLHKGMVVQEYNWKAGIVNNESLISLILGRNDRTQELSLKDASIWKGFWALVKLGIWHIWIGLDHILFIIALILPAVVRRREFLSDMSMVDTKVSANYSKSWLPVARFGPAFWYILSIVTFFTIAHSITLALAALEVVNLPSRFVESIIAISIALAAIHNITPIFKGREWVIAFLFGLFHGFGFASVLGEKGLGGDYMVLSLFGFNVGVEFGQIAIILLAFPILFLLRKSIIYPKLITFGSMLLILISLYWFVERAFDVEFAIGRYLVSPIEAFMG